MRKSRLLKIYIVLAIIIVVAIYAIGIVDFFTGDLSVSTFADISECEGIVERAQVNGTFEVYETAAADEHAEGLTYTDFFGGKYNTPTCNFEIYAYVFSDVETAELYYERATRDAPARNPDFSGSCGMFGADQVVLNENTVYAVYMPSRYEQKVLKLLAEVFSLTLFEG